VIRGLLAVLALSILSPIASAQVMVTPQQDPATKTQLDVLMTAQAQSVEATMDSNGNFTWTFPTAFTAKPRVAYFPQNSDVSGVPIVCNYQTLTTTAITFHCDKAAGSLVSLLNPLFNNRGASGAVVQVIARGTLVAPVMP